MLEINFSIQILIEILRHKYCIISELFLFKYLINVNNLFTHIFNSSDLQLAQSLFCIFIVILTLRRFLRAEQLHGMPCSVTLFPPFFLLFFLPSSFAGLSPPVCTVLSRASFSDLSTYF